MANKVRMRSRLMHVREVAQEKMQFAFDNWASSVFATSPGKRERQVRGLVSDAFTAWRYHLMESGNGFAFIPRGWRAAHRCGMLTKEIIPHLEDFFDETSSVAYARNLVRALSPLLLEWYAQHDEVERDIRLMRNSAL